MISIIVAVSENGVIGCHNRLIWHISEDLRRFKSLTLGHTVLMGRKTFESIGRPLPGRRNIVVSRNAQFSTPGVEVVGSVEDAIALVRKASEDVFIIGGGEIYRQSLPLAEKLYLTRVYQTPDGDTFFPEIDHDIWHEVAREDKEGYSFIDYERKHS